MNKKIDPALEWLSRRIAPMSPKEFLLEQAAALLAKSAQFRPPFNPQKALPPSIKGVEIVKLSRDGMLIPVQGGFIIKLNSEKPRVRQNFTCAHEIGHTYFYDTSGDQPWRPYESMSTYWAEEDLCYQFAEEMLMPQRIIKESANALNPSITNLRELSNKFQVSIEAMSRRITRLNIWQCILVIIEGSKDNSNKLRRRWVGKHRKYRDYNINWDVLLSQGYSPYNAFKNPSLLKRETISCSDLFRQGIKEGLCSIESFRFSGIGSQPVICIITPR